MMLIYCYDSIWNGGLELKIQIYIFFILFELNLRWKCFNFNFHSFRQSWPSSTAGVRPSTSRGTTTFCREDTQTHSRFAHSFSYLSKQCIDSLIRLHTIQPFAERTLKVRSYPFIHSFNHLHTQGSIICSKPFSHSFLYNTTQTQSSFVHLFSYLSIFPFIHSFIHSFSYDISQHSK